MTDNREQPTTDNREQPSLKAMLQAMNLRSPAPVEARLNYLRMKSAKAAAKQASPPSETES